jgi:hypothetical protein
MRSLSCLCSQPGAVSGTLTSEAQPNMLGVLALAVKFAGKAHSPSASR